MGILRLLPFASASVLAGGVAVNTVGKDSLLNTDLPAIIQEREKEKVDEVLTATKETKVVDVPEPASDSTPASNTPTIKSVQTPSGTVSQVINNFKYRVKRTWAATTRRGDDRCNIYVIRDQDWSGGLTFKGHDVYDSIHSLPSDLNKISGRIKCDSRRYFYVYSFFGSWEVAESDEAPVNQLLSQ